MTLHQCMTSMTNREFNTWMEWLDEEMNRPSRSDHYLMSIAQEVRRVLSSRPGQIQLDHFRLKFDRVLSLSPEQQRAQDLAHSKAAWKSRLYGVKFHETPPTES